ncbi:putative oxidoreductase [Haladaptatus litoreus]|uniref:Putative oxidoreductase n=1 Tax=Haladaptatus litoreus TaxID=553468 RepID=A0A1N7F327_9EURY|nr:DoxX family protein [Haladaptatus litoreus]SIR94767.1 putative oxidoreductase [Haladaptatus litoreus]
MSINLSIGTLLIRLAVGSIMIVHGTGKLFSIGPAAMSMPQFTGFLASLGVPAPSIAAWIVALIELVGGLCILVGFLTRFAAFAIAINMFAATLLVHLPEGFSDSELTIALCLVSLALVSFGAGKLSIDESVVDNQSHSMLPVGE